MSTSEDRLLLYLSGELGERERAELDEALVGDATLDAQLASLREFGSQVADLPTPQPARDLAAAAVAETSAPRLLEWPRVIKVAAAAALLVGAATFLHQRVFAPGKPGAVVQIATLQPEERIALTPKLLTAHRHIAGTKRRLFPEAVSEDGPGILTLDARVRQARRRLRAIRKRNPDLPEDETINNNGAMRQEGVRDETYHVDTSLFAAHIGERTVCPRG